MSYEIPPKTKSQVNIEYLSLKPFLIVFASWALALMIITFGLYYSYINEETLSFPRSCALIIVMSLYIASIDTSFLGKDIMKILEPKPNPKKDPKSIEEAYSQIYKTLEIPDECSAPYKVQRAVCKIHVKEELKKRLNQYKLSIPRQAQNVVTEHLTDLKVEKLIEVYNIKFRGIIQKQELRIAALGTLVWGFGDILVQYLLKV